MDSWADFFILGVVGISALLSLFRGLVREVLSLAGWGVACWAAFTFSGALAPVLTAQLSLPPSARVAVAFAALLVGVLFAFGILNFLIGKLISSTGLGGTDRMLGVLFGIARGLAIIVLLVVCAGLTPLPEDPWWQRSAFLPRLLPAARWAIEWLPAEYRDEFDYEPNRGSAPPGGSAGAPPS